MKVTLIIILAFLSQPILARRYINTDSDPTWAQTVKISKKDHFNQKITLVYGNKKYGYFEVSPTKTEGDEEIFEFLPPGYEEAVEFFPKYELNQKIEYGRRDKKKFEMPNTTFCPGVLKAKIVKGDFSTPYFLLSGAATVDARSGMPVIEQVTGWQRIKQHQAQHFLYIINRFGEVVWCHRSKAKGPSAIISKPLSKGKYGMMFARGMRGYFEIVDYKGGVLKELDMKQEEEMELFHHDFLFQDEDNILTMGREYRKNSFKHLPFIKENTLGTPIVALNISSGLFKIMWDPFKAYDAAALNPAKDPVWYKMNRARAPRLFTLSNSIVEVPNQGYLLSLRSIDKLVLLDKSYSKINWSLGASKLDTYQVKNQTQMFTMQHHATWVKENLVQIFDNGDKESRVVRYELIKKNNEAKQIAEYKPEPALFASAGGSAYTLPNENVIGYFVVTKGGSKPSDYLIEFSHETQKEIARIEISSNVVGFGYRGYPLQTVGLEEAIASPDALIARF